MLTGLDLLSASHTSSLRRRLRNSRVGLLTHAAATDRRGRTSLDVLEELGTRICRLFVPEHGYYGVFQAEEPVRTDVESTGELAPTTSLYADDRGSLSPSPEALEGLDLLVIDLLDVGARYYTFVWTALLALRAAAARGIHTVVLDRPNPLSGRPELLEGRTQAEGYLSFVGLEPLPIRHGLTIAELLAHFAERDGLSLGSDGALGVVPTQGWERHQTAAAWGRPFIAPSPNMPTLETALVYPGACLVEGTNLSEGRGTTQPFQTVGAPFLRGDRLASELLEQGVCGAIVRPVEFRPWHGKFAGEVCRGITLHVTDPMLFRPVATYTALLALARRQCPEHFSFIERAYEFESERLAFDLLSGSSSTRTALLDGAPVSDVVDTIAPAEHGFAEVLEAAEARLARALE